MEHGKERNERERERDILQKGEKAKRWSIDESETGRKEQAGAATMRRTEDDKWSKTGRISRARTGHEY